MPELVLPTTEVQPSFLAAMAEFRAEGRGGPGDASMIGNDHRRFAATWHTRAGFASYAQSVRAEAFEDNPRPDGYVPCTTWWYVDGDDYLGRIAVRHRLTEQLLEIGGHIGYDVRPSARRRGHATRMLQTVLPHAHALGIDPALVTCDVGNIASRKVIEAARGQLEDERAGKLRYWVPTSVTTTG
jgi:predicted acetyltransferase